MRIRINFTKNTVGVPINNQHLLNTYIHLKCLGYGNEYHNAHSNYSISGLCGGRMNPDKETLNFENGAFIVATTEDTTFLGKFVSGVVSNPIFTHGMSFCGIEYITDSDLCNDYNYFQTLSPIIVKLSEVDRKTEFLTVDNPRFNELLTNNVRNKLQKINPALDLSKFKIELVKDTKNVPKIKRVLVKNVLNVANHCTLKVYGGKQVANILYNLGIGKSTGSGFGTIYPTSSRNNYM